MIMTIIVSCSPSTQQTNTTCVTRHHWGFWGICVNWTELLIWSCTRLNPFIMCCVSADVFHSSNSVSV